jgi:putative FmdB family regulatory protein
MPMYPFHCPKCDEEFDILLSMADYDTTAPWDCLHCEGTVTKDDRVMVAANVTRASYVDGTVRPGFAENREIIKLKKESYNMKHEDRKDIKKTIKEIERSGK